ncbi:MAG TPA: hypothetical protein VHL31_19605 [Geminicoccus sp.]|jgi:hypothetical protein|uniref:hypothetical protein n=1 Tax=Geminicoccus sp. TaxID=2024832 RepID=UPI002E34066E|nr:hypothetical protein [Geminicoccus sp.]HEX2528493.1 hypothetical protein [Geminicoccus sp.]
MSKKQSSVNQATRVDLDGLLFDLRGLASIMEMMGPTPSCIGEQEMCALASSLRGILISSGLERAAGVDAPAAPGDSA